MTSLKGLRDRAMLSTLRRRLRARHINLPRGVPCLGVHGKDAKAATARQSAGRRLSEPHRVCHESTVTSMDSACPTCVRMRRQTAKIAPTPPTRSLEHAHTATLEARISTVGECQCSS